MAHAEQFVVGNAPVLELIDKLSGLALEHISELDGRGIPNVLWALGIVRQNPQGEGSAMNSQTSFGELYIYQGGRLQKFLMAAQWKGDAESWLCA